MGAVSKVTPWLPALSSELWFNSPFLSCHSVPTSPPTTASNSINLCTPYLSFWNGPYAKRNVKKNWFFFCLFFSFLFWFSSKWQLCLLSMFKKCHSFTFVHPRSNTLRASSILCQQRDEFVREFYHNRWFASSLILWVLGCIFYWILSCLPNSREIFSWMPRKKLPDGIRELAHASAPQARPQVAIKVCDLRNCKEGIRIINFISGTTFFT